MKGVIVKKCVLCGKTFKCIYKDAEGKAWAEVWEICPDCWEGGK